MADKKFLDLSGLSEVWRLIKAKIPSTYASSQSAGGAADKAVSIPFAQVDTTSTATAFTATVSGITELRDGVCVYLRNDVITSASGWTLNINGLGAKPVYQTLAAATRVTTLFNVNYTMLFVYNSTRVTGGCWDMFYGYNSDTNTIAYNVRSNASSGVMSAKLYRYQIVFTKPDGTLLPANTVSNTTGTTKALTTDAFDPFQPIYYYTTTTAVDPDAAPSASYLYLQYSAVDLRYGFNSGTSLIAGEAVYLKLSPQSDGTVKLAGNACITHTLPSTADGYVYMYLGKAYSTYQIWLSANHPIVHYVDGALRVWTNAAAVTVPIASDVSPAMDSTASAGSATTFARGDHVHPSDTTKITAPSSPATGAFLVWNGSAWTAQTLSTWQGGNY